MIRECFLVQTGIMFKAGALREVGLDPATLYPHVLPRPEALSLKEADPSRVGYVNGTVAVVEPSIILGEEEEELADALSPINDQLSLAPIWWLLELLPMRQKCLRKDGTWGKEIKLVLHKVYALVLTYYHRANLANGRFLPQDGNPVLVHRSVKIRVDHPEVFVSGPYVPRAGPWDKVEPVWVD